MCSTPCVVLVRVLSARPRASCAFAAFCRVMDASSCRLADTSSSELACSLDPSARLWLPELICVAAAATWFVAPATSDNAPSRLSSAVLSESLSFA